MAAPEIGLLCSAQIMGIMLVRDGDAGRIDEPQTVMVTRAHVVCDEQQRACGALQKIDALQ
jgi:hypothetical protein